MKVLLTSLATAAALGVAAPAQAGLLDGLGTCTLTLGTSGTMTMSPDGTTLGSQNSGGLGAVILLVGVNLTPELVFSAPSLIGPSGWSASPTTLMSVDTLSGTHTGYVNGAMTIRPSFLIDTLTIHSKVVSNTGFRQGSYAVASQVTCQSAS